MLKPLAIETAKERVLNSINSIQWKGIRLPSQTLYFGENIRFKLFPNFREFDLQSLFFREIPYEKEVFDFLGENISKYDAIIEIGANVGIYTLFFYKSMLFLGKESRIYAFEPSKTAYYRLTKNLELNCANPVTTYNCAIGNETGFFSFFEPEGHLTNGSLSSEFASDFSPTVLSTQALVVTGDMLSDLVKMDEEILVKIDVEGFEFEVLSGMEEFICYYNPTIIVEVLNNYENRLNTLEFLLERYNLYNITKSGLVPYAKFQATDFRDYVLLPKQSVKGLENRPCLES
jgi:FkbM family methyltransferase